MLAATYEYPFGKVEIWDDDFAGLPQEQLIARRKQAIQVSNRILDAADLHRVKRLQEKINAPDDREKISSVQVDKAEEV